MPAVFARLRKFTMVSNNEAIINQSPVTCSDETPGKKRMVEVNTLYGLISVPDWPTDLIVRALEAFGEWAPVEQRLFSSLIREHDRVWDGGAFLGTFGLGAVQFAASAGRRPDFLLAIEPGRSIAPHLGLNLQRNSPCSWDVSPYAISMEEQILYPANDSGENHGALSYASGIGETAESQDQSRRWLWRGGQTVVSPARAAWATTTA